MRLTFKFYAANFLISIALFFIYRIGFVGNKQITRNWFDLIINILDIFLNIHFAVIFLIVMVFSSITIFLNIIAKIRRNYFLSLLTFLAIPLGCIIYLIINLWVDVQSNNDSPLTTLVVFSIIYTFITVIEFLLFRKKIKKYEL